MATAPQLSRHVAALRRQAALVQADFGQIATLSQEDRKRLLAELEKNSGLVSRPPSDDEILRLSQAAHVSDEVAQATANITAWLLGALADGTSIDTLQADLQTAQLLPDEGTHAALDFLSGVANSPSLAKSFLTRRALSSILPTFSSLKVHCDVRFDDEEDSDTYSVAIVRIQADEGTPFTFQMTATDLRYVARRLGEAAQRLDSVEETMSLPEDTTKDED